MTGSLLLLAQEATGAAQWWGWLTLLVVVFGEGLAVFFAIRVLQSGGHPGATIAWIVLILVTPYLGLAIYYLLGRRLHLRRLRQRQTKRSDVEGSLPAAGPGTRARYDDPLLRLLDNLDGESVHPGNAVEVLGSGQEFAERAREAIDAARSFVHLEVYILRPDSTGRRFLEILTAKAREGVEVRVLYDSVGSWSLREEHLQELRAAGGRAVAFLPLLWRHRPFTINMRNHRKLLIVDGEVAFVGGRNVGDEYLQDKFGKTHRWLDSMVRIAGPAVRRLQRTFVEDWHTAADEALTAPRFFPEQDTAGEHTVAVVEGGPDVEQNTLHWMFLQMLMSARESIRISSPYLVPHASLLAAVQVAAARGVRVRIHTNGPAAENTLLFWAKRSYYDVLLRDDVEIVETVGDYNHSKLIVVDERYAFVGSPNLDVRSDELNFEIGAVLVGAAICREASELFDERIASGTRIERAMLRSDWKARLQHGLGRLAAPLL